MKSYIHIILYKRILTRKEKDFYEKNRSIFYGINLNEECFFVIGYAENVKTVTVSTADELLETIASDTKIVLNPGKYVLETKGEYETNLRIYGIDNLEIYGNGQAEIVLDAGYLPVVTINESNNITLDGLILGHDVPKYGCEGDGYVVNMWNAKNLKIDNSDLYGCGIIGIVAEGVENLTLTNSTIRDCMMGMAYISGFSHYDWNTWKWIYDGISDVTFNSCNFLRNAYSEKWAQNQEAFRGTSQESDESIITFNDCNFIDNHNTNFASDNLKLVINNCTFKNNAWDNSAQEMCFDVNQGRSNAEITNSSEKEEIATIIIAEYNNSILQNVTSQNVTFAAGEKKTYNFNEGSTYKVFVWDNLYGMRPLNK